MLHSHSLCYSYQHCIENMNTMMSLTLWCCDVCPVQRVHDAGIIFTERQVFYQMGHVYLQDNRGFILNYLHFLLYLLILIISATR